MSDELQNQQPDRIAFKHNLAERVKDLMGEGSNRPEPKRKETAITASAEPKPRRVLKPKVVDPPSAVVKKAVSCGLPEDTPERLDIQRRIAAGEIDAVNELREYDLFVEQYGNSLVASGQTIAEAWAEFNIYSPGGRWAPGEPKGTHIPGVGRKREADTPEERKERKRRIAEQAKLTKPERQKAQAEEKKGQRVAERPAKREAKDNLAEKREQLRTSKPPALTNKWLENKGIDKSRVAARPYTPIRKTIVNKDGSKTYDPKIAEVTRKITPASTQASVERQLKRAADQSTLVTMGRSPVKGSPFGDKLHPETRPDDPILTRKGWKEAKADFPRLTNAQIRAKFDADEKFVEPDRRNRNGVVVRPGGKETSFKEAYGSRFLYPPGAGNAMGIDQPDTPDNNKNFHPETASGNKRVILVNEGVQKTDNVLGRLEKEGRFEKGESVIGAGSVTLWAPNPYKLQAELKTPYIQASALSKRQVDKLDKVQKEAYDDGNKYIILTQKQAGIRKGQTPFLTAQQRGQAEGNAIPESQRVKFGWRDGYPMDDDQKAEQQRYLDTVKREGGGELHWIAKNKLEGREVAQVYDADGSPFVETDGVRSKNATRDDVTKQALQQKVFLEERGVKKAVPVYPPLDDENRIPGSEKSKVKNFLKSGVEEPAKGIDDHNGTLEDLDYLDIDAPSKADLEDAIKNANYFKKDQLGRQRTLRADKLKNMVDVLHAVSVTAADELNSDPNKRGISTASARRLAILLNRGLSPNTVNSALKDLTQAQLIERIRAHEIDEPRDGDGDGIVNEWKIDEKTRGANLWNKPKKPQHRTKLRKGKFRSIQNRSEW